MTQTETPPRTGGGIRGESSAQGRAVVRRTYVAALVALAGNVSTGPATLLVLHRQ
jgi:hypothetical protein